MVVVKAQCRLDIRNLDAFIFPEEVNKEMNGTKYLLIVYMIVVLIIMVKNRIDMYLVRGFAKLKKIPKIQK